MNEAGTHVPFIVHWPRKFPSGKRTPFFRLMDVLHEDCQLYEIRVSTK